jgi:hypothetical protein
MLFILGYTIIKARIALRVKTLKSFSLLDVAPPPQISSLQSLKDSITTPVARNLAKIK